MKYTIRETAGRRDLGRFIRFPHRVYRGHPNWVPPLDVELRRKLDPRRNPFFEYGQAKLFQALDETGKPAGRIAAVHNPLHREVHGEPAGFFGLFECVDDAGAARVLFEATKGYLGGFGCRVVLGPVNFSTNDDSGMLVEGHDERPMILCNYSPPYYPDLLAACGFEKAVDLLAYRGIVSHAFPPKYEAVARRAEADGAIRLRPFDRRLLDRDSELIGRIYNESFRDVWGFVPLSGPEALALGRSFAAFSDDRLVWIAEHNGEPAGFILALPDINEVLKDMGGRLLSFGIFRLLVRPRTRGIRVIALGVVPSRRRLGIETLLIRKVHEGMQAGGYREAEFSVVMENNRRMRNLLENVGFEPAKRYRIFRSPVLA